MKTSRNSTKEKYSNAVKECIENDYLFKASGEIAEIFSIGRQPIRAMIELGIFEKTDLGYKATRLITTKDLNSIRRIVEKYETNPKKRPQNKPKVSNQKLGLENHISNIQEMRKKGYTMAQISKQYNCSTAAISRLLRREELRNGGVKITFSDKPQQPNKDVMQVDYKTKTISILWGLFKFEIK